ncbi:unnamed protein product [Prunus brigantina]
MEKMQNYKVADGMKPVMVMVLVQILFAGMNILYKLVADDGINFTILIAYRMMFAAAFMLPLALVFERDSRTKLTWMVLFQAFLCGLFGGSLSQNLYIESIALTSATYAVAMYNLVPAITFILAIFFRMEKLAIDTNAGKAKVVGTVMGIGGAMLFTFYKGIEINIWSTHFDLHSQPNSHEASISHKSSGSLLLGSMVSLGSCVSYAIWLIIQVRKTKQEIPYSSTALMSLMGSIQSVVFALCLERDWNQWKLGWDIRLLAVSYSGVLNSGLAVTLIAWVVKKGGPLLVAVFQPLLLVMVALAGSLLLDEKLHLGSILGGLMIVSGLYAVLWGKSKELLKMTQLESQTSLKYESNSQPILVVTSIGGDVNSEKEMVESRKEDVKP